MGSHKYRTNIDNLKESQIDSYVTIIFCELCGHVKYDSNRDSVRNTEPSSECPATKPKGAIDE